MTEERAGELNKLQLPLEPVFIRVIDGPSKGAGVLLRQGTLRIGSHAECELQIDDPTVSRLHLVVELHRQAVYVRDMGSRNGTYYLNARLQEARIPLGGTVRVGASVLRFSPDEATARPLSDKTELCGLIGSSIPMRRLYADLERLGPSDGTVFVHGETGAGKEQVARALHTLSPRASHPFVVFDCGAVSPNLFESELFGHVKGAFTGADRVRPGVFERALGGTVFLDEVGELPLEVQPKLLRVLESREFKRVGDDVSRTSHARVLSATSRNLEEEVRAGRFRADLFYRLAVTVVHVPPLRDRPEDIPALARHHAKAVAGADAALTPATITALQCARWPGNVRELFNAVERALALGRDSESENEALAAEEGGASSALSYKQAREQVLEQFDRDYLATLLHRHRGNLSAAARESGLSRVHLWRLLKRRQLGNRSNDE